MIKWIKFSSNAIKNFPMGDNHIREFPIFLPPNYDDKRKKSYPLIFVLAGFGAKSSIYIRNESSYFPALQDKLEEAMVNRELDNAIIVFLDGSSKLGSSQYINSPVLGNYMDYIADELLDYLEKTFNIYRNPDYRAIIGHSSGGFATLVISMLKPNKFSHICSSAGDSFYELLYLPLINPTIISLEKHKDIENFLRYMLSEANQGIIQKVEQQALLMLGMAPCFSPNINNAPLFGDLFFDIRSGEIKPEIWNNYLNWDPIRMMDDKISELEKLKSITLEAGSSDEFGLQLGHRQLANKLKQNNINYSLNEYPGQHSGHSWRTFIRIKDVLHKIYIT